MTNNQLDKTELEESELHLRELMKYLNTDNIYCTNIPDDPICYDNDVYESTDNYVSIKVGEMCYSIIFDLVISWNVLNSLGDGYITEDMDYIDDVNIEINLLNIKDYENNEFITLNDEEYISEVNRWIKNIIYKQVW